MADGHDGATRETVGALRRRLARRLTQAGHPAAELDVRLLVQSALGLDGPGVIAAERDGLSAADAARIDDLVTRRSGGEPIAHILGRREFFGHDFEVTRATLIPRPDTECVLEAALEAWPERAGAARVVDFGTGSGCLLISFLLARRQAWGLGVDRSLEALHVARRNALRLGAGSRAGFVQGHWAQALGGPFDVVLANPPYIPRSDMATLRVDVLGYEPALALDGGPDGLEGIRGCVEGLLTVLRPYGVGVVEFGFDQRAAVSDLIAQEAGLRAEAFITDLAGRDRGIVLRRLEG